MNHCYKINFLKFLNLWYLTRIITIGQKIKGDQFSIQTQNMLLSDLVQNPEAVYEIILRVKKDLNLCEAHYNTIAKYS